MAYVLASMGFSPEQETTLLTQTSLLSTRAGEHDVILKELLVAKQRADQMRTFTVVATVAGLFYTLAKLGEFASDLRKRRQGD